MKFKKRDIIVYAVVVCLLLGIFIMSRPNGTNMDDEKVNSILLEDNNIDGIDYAEAFRSTALDIMQYEENDTGFNIAGSNADKEKAEALVEIFNSIGLENVEKIPVLMDGWTNTGVEINFPCDCSDNGILYMYRLGTYPATFSFHNTELELVYLNKGNETDYESVDVSGKGVLLSRVNELKSRVERAIDKGATYLIYPYESEYSTASYKVDIGLNLPTDIPIFVIGESNFNLLEDSMKKNNNQLTIHVTGSSELTKDVYSDFVVGEIPGSRKDEYIYVTANRDSIEKGFFSANVSVAELIEIAKELVNTGYTPKYTIKFLITTGSEWGSIDGGKNIGITEYLKQIDLNSVKSVLVIDGSRPLNSVVMTETQVNDTSDTFYEMINNYNEGFKEKGYRFINTINSLTSVYSTEGLVWAENGVRTVVQAEPATSDFYYIEDSSSDTSSLIIDSKQSQFLVEFYTGLLKEMCDFRY